MVEAKEHKAQIKHFHLTKGCKSNGTKIEIELVCFVLICVIIIVRIRVLKDVREARKISMHFILREKMQTN